MSTKEIQQELVANMRRWQGIEDASVSSTKKIIEKVSNPIVRIVMEIIQRDSQMHYRVQGLIADSLDSATISVSPEDLEAVWGMVEEHIELEKETVQIANESLAALKGKKMVVQEYLLRYLLTDESKHNMLLNTLETIKGGMYPYG